MDISEQLRCLFSANVEDQGESYQIEVPNQEIHLGDVSPGETYRVAIVPSRVGEENEEFDAEPDREHGAPEPPVEEGDTREVEIEAIGEQGDGITRVERGFVVIVPDTEKSERVSIEITDVQTNVAFAEVINRFRYTGVDSSRFKQRHVISVSRSVFSFRP